MIKTTYKIPDAFLQIKEPIINHSKKTDSSLLSSKNEIREALIYRMVDSLTSKTESNNINPKLILKKLIKLKDRYSNILYYKPASYLSSYDDKILELMKSSNEEFIRDYIIAFNSKNRFTKTKDQYESLLALKDRVTYMRSNINKFNENTIDSILNKKTT